MIELDGHRQGSLLGSAHVDYTLGPENGTLSVQDRAHRRRGQGGAQPPDRRHRLAGDVEVGEESSIVLTADPTSLRVREGTGGMQALGDDDKASIEQTIDDEVLKRQAIEFRSTAVQTDGDRLERRGRADARRRRPVRSRSSSTLDDDGKLSGSAVVKQSDWGITPYSTLFGTLKVVDEVEVAIDATVLPISRCRPSARRARPRPRAAGRRCRARRGRGPRSS